jgi:hypothetical protein
MKNFIQRVFFPSYKRTISVLVILILVLSVPITLRLVGQQQDLRQRAAEVCLTEDGSCGALSCAERSNKSICETGPDFCFWYGGGPGQNARCVDNSGNMNSSNICNGGHCYADQNYCVENRCTATAPPACPAGQTIDNKTYSYAGPTCEAVGKTQDTKYGDGVSGMKCCYATAAPTVSGGAPVAPAAPTSSAISISKFVVGYQEKDGTFINDRLNITVPANTAVYFVWTSTAARCTISDTAGLLGNTSNVPGNGNQLIVASRTSTATLNCGGQTEQTQINVGTAAQPAPTTTVPTPTTATGTYFCQVTGITGPTGCIQVSQPCSSYGYSTCTPGSTATTGNATFAFTTSLPGIASGGLGRNASPKKNSRTFSVALFAANTQTKGLDGIIGSIQQANLVFNGSNNYTGQIQLAGVTPGSYFVKVKTDNSNWKLIPGVQTLTQGSTTTLPQVALVTGDINNNNGLDVGDYSSMISCIKGSCDGNTKALADLNDDGLVDEIDLNILYSGFANRNGD